jgi:hypothetical protein
VSIFSVSYNAHVVTSPHGHVSYIAENLVKTLMIPTDKPPLSKWHAWADVVVSLTNISSN